MAQYSDGNTGDVDPNADNYWAFVTGVSMTNDPTDVEGLTFNPMDTFETNFFVRDGAGSAGDSDYAIHARNAPAFHPNDGFAFGGNQYHAARHWNFTAEISYVGQTETVTASVTVSRIVDTDNDASEPLHSTALVRFNDSQIQAIFDGPDGAGYAMNEIESVTLTAAGNELANVNIANRYDDPYPVLCFAGGTLIETDAGPVPVERLQEGDRVRTMDHGFQPIRWIGSRKIGTAELERNPKIRPVRITAGALGNGLPVRDLVVSRQHRVLVQSPEIDTAEALVPAKDLVALPGVEILDHLEHGVEYFHVLCENHEVLLAESMPAESMLTGIEALKALDDTAREEIAILMPELLDADHVPSPARRLLKGKPVRQIVQRHLESREPLSAQAM